MDRNPPALSLQVCFSPLSWPLFNASNSLVIVTDIFRASTSICAALHNGVEAIIPVEHISESREWKKKGFIIAGERDGKTLDCADFGNSPMNFMIPRLQGEIVVMNTTNGTRAIRRAAVNGHPVAIGSFINLDAVCSYAMAQNRDVVVLCAGWKDRFCLEDTLFAGALVSRIMQQGQGAYTVSCDSATASMELWAQAEGDLPASIEKAAHRHRLKKMGLDDVIPFCLTLDLSEVVPVLRGDRLVSHLSLSQ